MRQATLEPTRGVSRVVLGGAILAAAVVMLVLRLPGNVILMAGAPFASLLVTGVHRPPAHARWLWVFLVSATLGAFIAVFVSPAGVGLVNFATLALTFTMFSVAVLCSGDARKLASMVMTAVYWSFAFALLVGLMEVAADFKLQKIFYPDASNLAFAGRFAVAAWFPNYNDYSVVLTMFALMALTRFLFNARVKPRHHVGRAVMFTLASGMILAGGSRGALLGLLVGVALIAIHAVRIVRPRLISAFAVALAGLISAGGAVFLWFSPWVQDHSTTVRTRIVEDTIHLAPVDSPQFWFGWGALERFKEAASAVFPGLLMDSHNIIVEVFVWFGFPALVVLMWVWVYICWRGLWRVEMSTDWRATAAVMLAALTPVLGIVPSSALRYYYLFLILPCAIAALTPVEKHG